jgi:hypothetical protein
VHITLQYLSLKISRISLLLVLMTGLMICTPVEAQTIVRGKVTDAQTHEPVAFANVIFKGATAGAVADFDGNFCLSGKTKSDSILVLLVGYETKTIGIRPDTVQFIEIQMHPSVYALEEITVTPGENPAHVLLRNVWKNNPMNNIGKLSAFQYENYSRSTVFLRKFGYKSDEERRIKLVSKEFDEYAIKTGEEDIPALPSYITESISDNYYLNSPKREFTHIKAVNSEGIAFENTDLAAQLISKQENFYFYDNNVSVIDKSFISPLSRFGLLYYKYYIVDSMVLDNKYFCYEVRIIPRHEEDPVFHGTMWIQDSTFALKRISVEVSKKAELNFIQRIRIQQEYEPVDSGPWFAVETRFMADAANIFVNNYSRKSNIIVNKPIYPGFYGSEMKMNFDAQDYSIDYWKSHRLNSLEPADSLAFQRIDSLKEVPKINISAKIIEASIKGYFNLGWFEAGPYLMIYNHNPVEGNRFRLGGRTNIAFSRKFILEGYLAYGTWDNRIKGSIQAEYFLSKKHWTKTGIQYRDDIENIGSLDEFFSQSTFLTFATSFGGSDKMARSRVSRVWIESDILKGLQGKLIYTHRTFDPVSRDFYFSWITNPLTLSLSDHYITSELAFILRYQPKATFVLDGIRRFPVNFNKYPVLSIEYFRGFKGTLGGNFSYNKLVADVSQSFNAGGLGNIVYDVRFTKIFDPLPYPLLVTLAGNQSLFRSNRTYNLMHYSEFVLDEALEIFLSYHMEGLLLSRVPLIKKLQWRTVLSGHAALGSFDSTKNGFYNPQSNPAGILPEKDINGNTLTLFNTLSYDKPYVELSYGIENIFKFFRVDLVHRLTYLDLPDAHKFAIKISGVFRF